MLAEEPGEKGGKGLENGKKKEASNVLAQKMENKREQNSQKIEKC